MPAFESFPGDGLAFAFQNGAEYLLVTHQIKRPYPHFASAQNYSINLKPFFSLYMTNFNCPLSTGYGHFAPRTLPGRLFCMVYALFGIPVTWLMLTSLGRKIVEYIGLSLQNRECKPETKLYNLFCLLVATLLAFFVMMVIALVGMFAENWTFFEGMYFAFISLTTIGFGDYVPMHPNFNPKDVERSSFSISLFVLFCFLLFSFGLAVNTSVLLSIRKIMEDKTIFGFHSLYNSESDDEEDTIDEEEEVNRNTR